MRESLKVEEEGVKFQISVVIAVRIARSTDFLIFTLSTYWDFCTRVYGNWLDQWK
tara:strand:- start:19 stop:183 length:165 start_codon:yes stop_codon:yes gene_type:complete